MDSAVLLSEALRRFRAVQPLYIRCGLRWERAELFHLRKFLSSLRPPRPSPLSIVEVTTRDIYGPHWSLSGPDVPGYRSRDEKTYLPGRNILLLSKAAVFCALRGLPRLWLGPLRGNPFPDARPAFLKALSVALRKGLDFPITIQAPFAGLRKRDIVVRGRDLPLHLTFSCLNPRGLRPCGQCNKCAERDRGLKFFHPSK